MILRLYVVFANGAPSSRRIFPFLKRLLPAIRAGIELVCVQKPQPEPQEVAEAEHCLNLVNEWLTRCGKTVKVKQPAEPDPEMFEETFSCE
jgi:hypothetical protein